MEDAEMTIGGWIFMLGSVGSVVALGIWCFARVLSLPPAGPEASEEDAPIVRPPPGT
jgi:hypothetical protein